MQYECVMICRSPLFYLNLHPILSTPILGTVKDINVGLLLFIDRKFSVVMTGYSRNKVINYIFISK